MKGIVGLLASPAGRVFRAVLGIVLILAGVLAIGGVVGWIIAAIGAVLVAAGVFDFCVLSPLLGLPFSGPTLRHVLGSDARGSP
jgi:hypothetical protein